MVASSSIPLRAKFAAVRSALAASLVERDEEIDLCLTALVAREHVLLVGPPGLAKSALLDGLLACAGGSKFSVLMTKYTQPEELFGPVSLSALKSDRYIRVTTGKLPEVEFLFADELFKASSAILNTLLKILNERVYDPGDGVLRTVPLRLCLAASNEWPDPDSGKELAAALDRFLFRMTINPVRSTHGRKRLLWETRPAPRVEHPLSASDLDTAHREAMVLPWTQSAKEAFEAVLREMNREGVRPGDRRQVKTIVAVSAFAWLNGAESVKPEHLEIAQHTLWDSPEEQPLKAAKVIMKVANPTGMRVSQLLFEADEIVSGVDPRSLTDAAKAAAKLGEVEKQLAVLTGDPRAEKARLHVKDQLKKLRLASLDAV
jgi:MoxR-like ATPase